MLTLKQSKDGNMELRVDGHYCGMILGVKLIHKADDPDGRYIAMRRKKEIAYFWIDPSYASIEEEIG